MLDDLDTVDWAALSHAYGCASDVPGLLRGLAAGDRDALHDLYGNIWHQGTVFEATAFAVPFLIQILDEPSADVSGVLGLLSAIGEGSSYMDVHQRFLPRSKQDTDEVHGQITTELSWVAAARDAVATGMPSYLRLLASHPNEDVRAAAADTIRSLGRVDTVGDTTRSLQRAATDDDSPLVRAAAVLTLGASGQAVEGYLPDRAPLTRLAAAVLIAAKSGRPDEADQPPISDAVLQVIERDAPASLDLARRLPMDLDDPLTWVINALSPHWQLQIRLLTVWMRHPNDDVRSGAAFATEIPLRAWRPAAAQLVPTLAAALADPCDKVRRWAGRHLAGAGRANAAVADELWAAVERGPTAHNTPGASALTALSRLHDPRADSFLASRLSVRPGRFRGHVDLGGLRPAIDALGPWSTACRPVIVDAVERAAAGNDRIGLILAAGRLAVPAADLVPVLRRQAQSHPHATSRVLGDLGPAAAKALPELTSLRSSRELVVRVNAARAIWRITGKLNDLLAVLRADISDHHALQVLAEVGPPGAALADLLPPMFDHDNEWSAVCAAMAYWHLTGDADPVVPVLIRYAQSGPRGLIAVRCLADIGPAAAIAAPQLQEAVNSPYRPVQWGGDTTIITDEAWMDACTEALDRIQPHPSGHTRPGT